MIQEKELEMIQKYLDEIELIPLDVWPSVDRSAELAEITGCVKDDADTIKFTVDIEKNSNLGVYILKGYEATLMHIGEIQHHVIAGINTADLEAAMKKIEWRVVLPEFIKLFPNVVEINERLNNLYLSNDAKGKEIAGLLTLKYFTGTPLENSLGYWDLGKELETKIFIELNGNDRDLNLKEAYHLLCGRGVARSITNAEKKEELCWLVISEGKVTQVEDFEISKCLAILPFDKPRSVIQEAEDIAQLTVGKQVLGKFSISNKTFHAYYEPDPLKGDLALRDLKQNRIDIMELRVNPELINDLPRKEPKKGKSLGL